VNGGNGARRETAICITEQNIAVITMGKRSRQNWTQSPESNDKAVSKYPIPIPTRKLLYPDIPFSDPAGSPIRIPIIVPIIVDSKPRRAEGGLEIAHATKIAIPDNALLTNATWAMDRKVPTSTRPIRNRVRCGVSRFLLNDELRKNVDKISFFSIKPIML